MSDGFITITKYLLSLNPHNHLQVGCLLQSHVSSLMWTWTFQYLIFKSTWGHIFVYIKKRSSSMRVLQFVPSFSHKTATSLKVPSNNYNLVFWKMELIRNNIVTAAAEPIKVYSFINPSRKPLLKPCGANIRIQKQILEYVIYGLIIYKETTLFQLWNRLLGLCNSKTSHPNTFTAWLAARSASIATYEAETCYAWLCEHFGPLFPGSLARLNQ